MVTRALDINEVPHYGKALDPDMALSGSVSRPHLNLFLTANPSSVPPLSTAHGPLGFFFSSTSPPHAHDTRGHPDTAIVWAQGSWPWWCGKANPDDMDVGTGRTIATGSP